ncbi:THUMP domain-containing class I SAM-dependent RNA methyltransferase [Haloflavibacter putidus]|uniref:Class I SAM-dependent RNA methyltransferase n=1 Tax=Haloflavibacter putidus TaxID=2576776 RepID=A0A507ZP33_9FLAO|nr:THUMP domain-containing protein [Haloflavibacter putidus]TQD39290.1 class I SAM-dependent RNA methyltransferase [Haloflavibacter putidus]
MGNNYKMLAKTLYGFEDLLEKELRNLGAMDVKKGVRNVTFVGDKGFMYKANLALRTAIKILKPIRSFKVFTEEDLYNKIRTIDWSDYLSANQTLAIDSTVHSKVFTHSKFIALKTKDAIVDQFREKTGHRPSIDLDYPDLRINIHIEDKYCTVSLDSSGQSLHKRGYRSATNLAPINEVLAAGMLMLSGWDGRSDFLDPMCGSGTILVEAAMIACNIPPNLNKKEFGFEKWKNWDVELFEKIEESLLNRIRGFEHKIIGYDKASSAVYKAVENVKNANLSDFIEIEQCDFFRTEKPVNGPLHMVFNPPYGERLELLNLEKFYEDIGNTLKRNYHETQAWFIVSNLEAIKNVGLRPSKKIKLYNGKLESRFLKYEIYEGSKKAKKESD